MRIVITGRCERIEITWHAFSFFVVGLHDCVEAAIDHEVRVVVHGFAPL